ncbi:MAG: beta-ketoacyl-ACP synthase II [Oscillospiraceae bacterium]
MRRVVITGTGVISPLGNTADELWENIKQGKNGISEIEGFDSKAMGVTFGGQVKNFEPTEYGIEKKHTRRMDKFSQYAVAATKEAIEMSGFDKENCDPFRVGVIIGSGVGGMETIHNEHKKYIERGAKRISPFFVPMMICNMAAAQVAIYTGFKGDNYCPVTACASSAHAIGEGYRKIKDGYLDACVVGGSEASVHEFGIASFQQIGALSTATELNLASIPFDKRRSGFVMSEGSAVLFIEDYESAKKRGANILGEIVGYGATCDAYHITSPSPTGEGGAMAMEMAIKESGADKKEIGYINAHGTSTHLNDLFETRAIKTVFGDLAKELCVSSTKSMTGHLLGAAGSIEAIITAFALKDGVIPPTINSSDLDEECDLDYVLGAARKKQVTYAISNSLGFGGHNATLCFKKFVD